MSAGYHPEASAELIEAAGYYQKRQLSGQELGVEPRLITVCRAAFNLYNWGVAEIRRSCEHVLAATRQTPSFRVALAFHVFPSQRGIFQRLNLLVSRVLHDALS
jgi:hypothetical protein